MFYRKNIYAWEQGSRILLGLCAAAFAFYMWPATLLAYGLAAMGVGLAITGVIGWCQLCAMAGRKITDKLQ